MKVLLPTVFGETKWIIILIGTGIPPKSLDLSAVGYPFKGAMTKINECDYIISEAQSVDDRAIVDRANCIGKVIDFSDGSPVVVCGSGLLRVQRIMHIESSELFTLTKIQVKIL